MPGCYRAGPPLRRPFLVTSYIEGRDGRLVAQLPSCCPHGAGEPGEPAGSTCVLAIDHHRQRKTGPVHPLAVVRCRTHRCGFTLYPPGFAPYGRQPLLKVEPDGNPIQRAAGGLRGDFEDTVFAAALDGADGRPWARDSDFTVPDRWWSTQDRHLHRAARLVGIARDLADRVRESIAAVLSVTGLMQRERSSATGYRGIGRAVCDVLRQLCGRKPRRALALLVCGHLVGHWGEPLLWDADRKVLERSPFCAPGTSGAQECSTGRDRPRKWD